MRVPSSGRLGRREGADARATPPLGCPSGLRPSGLASGLGYPVNRRHSPRPRGVLSNIPSVDGIFRPRSRGAPNIPSVDGIFRPRSRGAPNIPSVDGIFRTRSGVTCNIPSVDGNRGRLAHRRRVHVHRRGRSERHRRREGGDAPPAPPTGCVHSFSVRWITSGTTHQHYPHLHQTGPTRTRAPTDRPNPRRPRTNIPGTTSTTPQGPPPEGEGPCVCPAERQVSASDRDRQQPAPPPRASPPRGSPW